MSPQPRLWGARALQGLLTVGWGLPAPCHLPLPPSQCWKTGIQGPWPESLGGPSTQNLWGALGAVERAPPANSPSPPLPVPGGLWVGRGTHPAPAAPPGWGGRAQPAPLLLGVSLAFPPRCTGQEAPGAGGCGGAAPSDPPLPRHNEPGREGRFLQGVRVGAEASRGSLPHPPSGHTPGAGGSLGPAGTPLQRVWEGTRSVAQGRVPWGGGSSCNCCLWQGGFPAQLQVLLELEGTRLVLELEQNW